MQLFAKISTATLALDVNEFSTIMAVKAVIAAKTGVPVAQQALVCEGRSLPDAGSIADCGVASDATLHVHLRLLGGGTGSSSAREAAGGPSTGPIIFKPAPVARPTDTGASSGIVAVFKAGPEEKAAEGTGVDTYGDDSSSVLALVKDEDKTAFFAFLAAKFPSQALGLVYRATRDGPCAKRFHEKVDGLGYPTVTLVAAKPDPTSATVYVFGGYTTATWTSEVGPVAGPGSFLFSVTGPVTSPDGVIVYPALDDDSGIEGGSNLGPAFDKDLEIQAKDKTATSAFDDGSLSLLPSAYSDPLGRSKGTALTGTRYFTPVDVEVWALAPPAK